jgi:serine/threonine protein phosphatase PrpC
MEEHGKDIVVYSLNDTERKKENNEDSFLSIDLEGKGKSGPYLMAVPDGMGGTEEAKGRALSMIEVLGKYVAPNTITAVNRTRVSLHGVSNLLQCLHE